MAGYTSRFFLTLTIPSVFGFFSVLWFLKRKSPTRSVSKAVQVEDSPSEGCEDLFLNPMKLKTEEEGCEGSVSSEMQLKETTTNQSQNANGIQQNGKVKGKKKSKSKSRENSSTRPKDSLTNGNDNDHPLEDKGIDLAYGIEAIDLSNDESKDEIYVHANNKTNSEMEVELNDTNSSQTNLKVNGTENGISVSETGRSTSPQNVESVNELCDKDAKVSSETNCTSVEEIALTDAHEPLTLPVGYTEIQGEMLESPGATYCDSVGSSDSGKGPSENQFETYQGNPPVDVRVYEFDILQELVGLLIGRNGRHVRYIKEQTNANILIKRHPFFGQKKICSVTGSDNEIHAALKMIRKRFPAETYPTVTLSQISLMPFNVQSYIDSPVSSLSIPNGVSFEAMLCATVNAGHFFIQQPTHPSFHSLPSLTTKMSEVYSADLNAPPLAHMDIGYICAAEIGGGWFRAAINEAFEETDECKLKFLDYGGYAVVPRSTLKQIRIDFMHLPFQATECYLGGVTVPDGETEWSLEATAAFEELAQGQIVQGYVVGYHEDKVPFVNLYKVTGATSIFINRELVSRGLAKWISSDME